MTEENSFLDSISNEELRGHEAFKEMKSVDDLASAHIGLVEKSSMPWHGTLSDEIKTEENMEILKDFETNEDLAKAYLELKAKDNGTGGPEIPETPDAYEIPVPEGQEVNEELSAIFKPVFHKLNLTQGQVTGLVEPMNEYAAKVSKAQAEADQKDYDDAVNALKDEWKGQDGDGNSVYEQNMEAANMGFAKVCAAAKVDKDSDTLDGWRNNPDMCRIFYTIGKAVGEGSFEAAGSVTKDEAMGDEEFMEKEVFKGK